MARNLARAPEKASALAFLERARELRRGTVRAMQAGLQAVEQRQPEVQGPQLARSFQDRRESEQVAAVTEPLREVVHRQVDLMQRLRSLVPVVRQKVGQALETAQPMLRRVAERFRKRSELEGERLSSLKPTELQAPLSEPKRTNTDRQPRQERGPSPEM
jgi:hypothetical protein